MKRLFTLIFCLAVSAATFAQQKCATMEMDSIMRANNPKMESLQDFEQWMQQKISFQQSNQNPSPLTQSVKVIPVVVHVIYSTAGENISQAQVQSQIDILNEDFRRLNADSVNTPSGFQAVAADCQIQFCLAQQDPNGGPTNGINRVYWANSPFTSSYVDNTIKPATQWDPNSYLNIWVANLSGGLLGWAQFPNSSGLPGMNANNGNANTDGVVILYTSVGRPPANPYSGPYNLGRTATHEIGHWLGLRHIWGDGNCTVDDYCNDTPTSDASNYGCPTTHVSCSSTDMVQNYMDYTDDGCMNLFTFDQKARMDVVLSVSPRRASLLTSGKCNPPNSPPIADFSATPPNGCPGSSIPFSDLSMNGPTNWNWSFPGGTPSSSSVQNPTVSYSTPGTYSVTLICSNSFGADTITKTNYITIGNTGQALPFTEDFESGGFTLNNWTIDNPDASTTWQVNTVSGNSGVKAAGMDFYSYNAQGQEDGLITPLLDFSGYSSIDLDFDHAYRRYNNSYSDSLFIEISTDCGATWSRVFADGGNGLRTSSNTTSSFTPSTSGHWCGSGTYSACRTVNLNAFIGNPNVKLKFVGYNDYGNNLYLDNINLSGVLAPVAPVANFNVSGNSICQGGSVSCSDLSTNNPTSWSWNVTGPVNQNSAQQNPAFTFNTPGTYSIQLIASNGNGSDTLIMTNYLTVNANPGMSMVVTDVNCNGAANGSATATPSGGGSPYAYSWNTGDTTATISGLAPGTYVCTVTDGNTCQVTDSVTVTEPSVLALNGNSTDATCGSTNGAASVNVSGGTPNYAYAWNTGATTSSISGIGAGNYQVIVTDANGCKDSVAVNVNNIGGPTVVLNTTAVACFGDSSGAISSTVTGGTPNYTYLWNTGANTSGLSNVPAGNYTVTVTDQNGCVTNQNVAVSQPAAITLAMQGSDANCGSANGSVSVIPSGGTPGYAYSWNTGANTASVSNLNAGTYVVTVTDSNGCTAVDSVSITNTGQVSVTASGTDPNCSNSNDGTVTANAGGGGGAYTYSWNTGNSTASVNGLPGGTYTVTVTDQFGCTSVDTVTITAPAPIVLNGSSTGDNGTANGTASVNATGGTPPYTYLWNDPGAQTTQTAGGLAAGSYMVTVTDSNGCTATTNVTVDLLTHVIAADLDHQLEVYPNPTTGQVYLRGKLNQATDLEVRLISLHGQLLLARELAGYTGSPERFDLSEYAAGVYFLEIRSGEKIIRRKIVKN